MDHLQFRVELADRRLESVEGIVPLVDGDAGGDVRDVPCGDVPVGAFRAGSQGVASVCVLDLCEGVAGQDAAFVDRAGEDGNLGRAAAVARFVVDGRTPPRDAGGRFLFQRCDK